MPPARLPLVPERLRTIERPFGWAPCRLLNTGLLAEMSSCATKLYLLLVLAADRRGLSCYGDRRIQQVLDLQPGELRHARAELVALDLLAFDASTYQLLSFPVAHCPRSPPATSSDPAEATHATPTAPHGLSDETKETLRRLLGRDFGV